MGTVRARARIPRLLALLWWLHLVSSPFYLFSSGIPQSSDILLCLVIAVALAMGGLFRGHVASAGTSELLLLIAYIVAVNSAWILILQDPQMLVYPIFYLFNAAAFLICAAMYDRFGASFLRVTFSGMAFAVGLQVLAVPFVRSTDFGAREPLFFNNPNQLGYFALVAASLILLLSAAGRRRRFVAVVAVGGCLVLAALSLSKAAMVAIGVALIVTIARNKLVVASLIAMLAWTYLTADYGELFELVETRMTSDQHDDGLEMRGYDRIVNHPRFLLFGAGEGAWRRFDSYIDGELHSSMGTIVFSYGIVGLGLFAWFVGRASGARKLMFAAYVCPLALYGLTHNGLRSTLAWEFLAILASVAQSPRTATPRVTSAAAHDRPRMQS